MSRNAAARMITEPVAMPLLDEMERHAGDAERLMRVLANRHRLMVLCALVGNEMSVGELNARVPLSQSALSQHLALMRTEGLVDTRRDGQTIYYRVADGPALQILNVLHGIFCSAPQVRRANPRSRRRKA